LIDQDRPDAALLEVIVAGRTSSPVATRLAMLDIPFVVVTGYSRNIIPASLRNAAYVAKPFLREELIEDDLISPRSSRRQARIRTRPVGVVAGAGAADLRPLRWPRPLRLRCARQGMNARSRWATAFRRGRGLRAPFDLAA
jgi:hypothetical protein